MEELLSDEDSSNLIMSLATVRGEKGFTEEEAVILLQWAEGVLVEHSLLTLVLNGDINVDITDGEPAFSVTSQGADKVEQMIENRLGPQGMTH